MSLVKFNRTLPSIFDDFFNGDLFDQSHPLHSTRNSQPAVNIKENGDGFQVDVAAPGLDKKDFKVELDHNKLIISSEKEEKNENTNEQFTRKEFSYRSFKRVFTLPDSVNGDQIGASYENGVLSLHIPKREEAKLKPSRLIDIA